MFDGEDSLKKLTSLKNQHQGGERQIVKLGNKI